MTLDKPSLLTFPCDFPIKIMGVAAEDFDVLVISIIRKHVTELDAAAIKGRHSRGGKYRAVTVTIQASSQGQLDAIYRELSGHERVLMVL